MSFAGRAALPSSHSLVPSPMMPRLRSLVLASLAASTAGLVALPAHAVGTRTFVLDSIERLYFDLVGAA